MHNKAQVGMSPCMSKILSPDGLHDTGYEADSLAEATQFEPDGVYTVANTFNTYQTLKLDAHLDRMEDSARREGIPLALDRLRLKAALRQLISEASFGDVRFRITVPRYQPDHLWLAVEPFTPPAESLIREGVRCITTGDLQRRNPAAKTNEWAQYRQVFTQPEGIYEVLLLSDEGCILEGFTSNFYAVTGDELRTAGEGMLPGISQQVVFTVAPAIIPVRREAVAMSDIPRLREAFITSSSRGVIPVVEIDGVHVGDGRPGAITLAIRDAYQQWVAAHLETL